MPSHVYPPENDPSTWRDRLLVHPLEVTVAVIAVVFAVLVALSLIVPGLIPSKSMDQMPWIVATLIAAFLGIGGLLTMIGLNYTGDDVSNGWALERFGWLLAAGGFLTYALSVSWHYPGSIFSWLIPLMLGAGSLIRVMSLVFIERGVRRKLAELNGRTNE